MNGPGGELASAYGAMVECWAVGGEARRLAPGEWADIVAGLDQAAAERALVALAGQFHAVALRPALPADAATRPPLPQLPLPPAPQALRRALRSALSLAPVPQALIRLVARRGFAVHPADWFPGVEPGWVPECYQPWVAWARGAAAAAGKPPASQSASQSASQAVGSPPGKAASNPANKAARRPPSNPASQAASQSAGQPAAAGISAEAEKTARKLIKRKSKRRQALALLEHLGPEAQAAVVAANLAPPWEEPEVMAQWAQAAAQTVDRDLIGPQGLAPGLLDVAFAEALVAGAARPPGPPEARQLTALATMMTPTAAHSLLSQLEYRGVHPALPAVAALALNVGLADAAGRGATRPGGDGIGQTEKQPTTREGNQP